MALRGRAARVRAAAEALETRSDALARSMMKEMLARQAEILRGAAANLEDEALKREPPEGSA